MGTNYLHQIQTMKENTTLRNDLMCIQSNVCVYILMCVLVMARITATACFFDNRNRDTVVSMTTATTVIFFNNREHFKKLLYKKKFILPMLRFKL